MKLPNAQNKQKILKIKMLSQFKRNNLVAPAILIG